MNWINDAFETLMSHDWVAQVFLIVLVSQGLNFILQRVLLKAEKRLAKTDNLWDDLVIKSLQKPASLMVWLLGLTFAADILQEESNAAIFAAIEPIRNVGVIVILTIFLLQLIKGTREILVTTGDASEEKDFDEHTVDAISKLLRISVFITSALVVLQTLGYSVSGVLAFGGIGGIAIGFAAKDLLANFFGGLMIYLDRPFALGDWIRSDDREIEGTVEHIGWRLTRIRTFDKRPLYIPNSVFMTIAVENPSRMTNRRIYETISLRYEDANKMDAVVDDVKKMLQQHPEIDTDQTLIVNLVKYAASSLDFFVYTFTKTTDWVRFHEIKQDVMLKIIKIVEQHQAEFAFPTSSLHVETLPEHIANK